MALAASPGRDVGREHAELLLDLICGLDAPRHARSPLLAYAIVISDAGTGTPGTLAAGLRWAAGLNPDAVAVPCGLRADAPEVRAASDMVLESGAALFAAVGNPLAGQRSALYPAAYPGAIAVGAPS